MPGAKSRKGLHAQHWDAPSAHDSAGGAALCYDSDDEAKLAEEPEPIGPAAEKTSEEDGETSELDEEDVPDVEIALAAGERPPSRTEVLRALLRGEFYHTRHVLEPSVAKGLAVVNAHGVLPPCAWLDSASSTPEIPPDLDAAWRRAVDDVMALGSG